MELAAGPALAGHGDHLGVEVDADRASPALGELGDRTAAPATGVDHGPAGERLKQLVGTRAQLAGSRLRVGGVEDGQQSGHARHART